MRAKIVAVAVALAFGTGLPAAHATNGYMSHAYSPAAKGLAGAGEAALPQDAMAIVGNPAGITRVGRRLDVGLALFSPSREYDGTDLTAPGINIAPVGSSLTGGNVESEMNYFFVPNFGYTHPIDNVSSVGVAVFGNGGMNTDYRAKDTFMGVGTYGGNDPVNNFFGLGDGDAGVNLEQLGISIGYARDLTDAFSIGVSGLIGYQKFEAKGLGAFAGFTETFTQAVLANGFGAIADGSARPGSLTNRGDDSAWGYAFQIGALWDVNPMFSVGLSYRTKMYMEEFDKYSDLFADDGDFDIPAVGTIGLAFRPNEQLTLAFDIQHIWYGDIDAIANTNQLAERCDAFNTFGNAANFDSRYCLGGSKGAGFGWDDMTVFKFGVQYALNDEWTLRAGYSYADQLIDGREVAFNALAPAVIKHHFTLGGTWKVRDNYELTFWGMYAPEESVSGPGAFTTGSSPEIKMSQYELGVNFAWLFD